MADLKLSASAIRYKPRRSKIDMGAIDAAVARSHAKIKSASIEASSNQLPLTDERNASALNQYDFDGQYADDDPDGDVTPTIDAPPSPSASDCVFRSGNNSANTSFFGDDREKKSSTLSPGTLKPSVSTSCLITADNTTTSSNTLICVPTRASLTHEWKKLKTPNKCRECNLLVYFNGRECSFCGFVAHKKCVTILVIKCRGQQVTGLGAHGAANQECRKENQQSNQNQSAQQQQYSRKVKPPPMQPIFGQPIGDDSVEVVDFLRRFVYEIDARGLASKGIYRVSSIKSKVDRLCNYYDQNLSSLVDLSSFHPSIIANALKMYLRQLPEPLLTHELYNKFIEIAKKYPNSPKSSTTTTPARKLSTNKPKPQSPAPPKHQRKPYYPLVSTSTTTSAYNDPNYNPLLIVELKEIIELLPPINRQLIAIIMHHLKRVADMSWENQMSATNLSIIFGPTLLSNANDKSLAIVDNIHQARVVELMITWADQIFPQYDNYESKAVIELDLTELQREQYLQMTGQKPPSDNYYVKYVVQNLEKQPTTNNQDSSKDEDPKTRKDLQELRRKFFTVPTVQTDEASDDQYKSRSPELDLKNPRSNNNNPPGSVPVVKMQPFYCKTLTKYIKDK